MLDRLESDGHAATRQAFATHLNVSKPPAARSRAETPAVSPAGTPRSDSVAPSGVAGFEAGRCAAQDVRERGIAPEPVEVVVDLLYGHIAWAYEQGWSAAQVNQLLLLIAETTADAVASLPDWPAAADSAKTVHAKVTAVATQPAPGSEKPLWDFEQARAAVQRVGAALYSHWKLWKAVFTQPGMSEPAVVTVTVDSPMKPMPLAAAFSAHITEEYTPAAPAPADSAETPGRSARTSPRGPPSQRKK